MTSQRVREVQPELGEQRLVEPELMADAGNGGRCPAPRQLDLHGVARNQVNDEERRDEQAEQDHDGQRHPSDDVIQHRIPSAVVTGSLISSASY